MGQKRSVGSRSKHLLGAHQDDDCRNCAANGSDEGSQRSGCAAPRNQHLLSRPLGRMTGRIFKREMRRLGNGRSKWTIETFSGRSLSNLKQRFFYRDKGCLSDLMRRAAPVLAHFKAQKPVLVETEASDFMLRAGLPAKEIKGSRGRYVDRRPRLTRLYEC